jgi:hypothetical protein
LEGGSYSGCTVSDLFDNISLTTCRDPGPTPEPFVQPAINLSMIRYSPILLLVLLITQTAFGQKIHREVNEIYEFQPHLLKRSEQGPKGDLMDAFWSKVSADTATYLPELRAELMDTSNPAFFFYDGSKLLLSLSRSLPDCQIALDAIARCSLPDVDATDYLKTVHMLAAKNLNTTDAALKIIDTVEFTPFIVEHALLLDKDMSLAFMLLPIDRELYVGKTLQKLDRVGDSSNIKALLNFLWYASTCQADSAIARFAASSSVAPNVRRYAAWLVTENDASRRDLPTKYAEMERGQAEAVSRISDEAIYDLNSVTKEMKGYYLCK